MLGELAGRVVGAGPAAFVAGHEQHRARGERMRRGRPGDLLGGFKGREEGVDRRGSLERLGLFGRELVVGGLLECFGAVGGLGGEEGVEVHRHRGAVFLLGLDRDRRAVGKADPKTHHHFVDAANLLDVERAVGEPLTVQHQELFEDAVERAFGNRWNLLLRAGGGGAAFEPWKPVWIEEVARPCGKFYFRVRGAGVDQPKECDELGPGAEAQIHRVGMLCGVAAEPLEEAVDAVVLLVEAR